MPQKRFWRMVAEALTIPPVYASVKPSDAALAEGWKVAYEQEREKRIAAEKKLKEYEKKENS